MIGKRTHIESALIEKPWSLTGAVFGIEHVHDVDGRPLGERRAPADARRDVPMELTACPYHDERHGRLMNASALEQLTRHFGAVTKEVASFHALLPDELTGWDAMFAAVMDQLSSPAQYLLRQHSADGPVPVLSAASHKLALGYFGTMVSLLVDEARRPQRPPTVESFMQYVHDTRALIGASEVCGGQPRNIEHLTRLFLFGRNRETIARDADPARVVIACTLCDQVRLGQSWKQYDAAMEAALLTGPGADRLRPRTQYLADRMAARVAEQASGPAPFDPTALLPDRPGCEQLEALRCAITSDQPADAAHVAAIAAVMAHGDAAIVIDDAEVRRRYTVQIANTLTVYRAFVAAQCALEAELRVALGYAVEPGVQLSATMFPNPKSLSWVEIFTGHRLQCTPGLRSQLALRNQHRVVPVM